MISCVRCLVPTPATTEERFTYGSATYRLDLCEAHADRFQSDVLAWLRLAEEVEGAQTAAASPGGATAPPVAPQPVPPRTVGEVVASYISPHVAYGGEVVLEPEVERYDPRKHYVPPVPPPRPEPEPDPDSPEQWSGWYASSHALDRMKARGLTKDEVLEAVKHPLYTVPGKEVGTTVLYRGSVKVVANRTNRSIITVARKDDDAQQAG
jgi:hypothetical protein